MGILEAFSKAIIAYSESRKFDKAKPDSPAEETSEKPKAKAIDTTLSYAQGLMGVIGKGLKKPSSISFNTLRRMSKSYVIARLCISTLKHEITKIGWHIVSKDPKLEADPEKVKRIEDLLRRPNGNNETWRTFLDKTLEDILTLDAGVWEKVRNSKGEIAEIYYVDGATIRPCFDENGQVASPAYVQYIDTQLYKESNPIADWENDDMVYIMNNPQADVKHFGYGLSPMENIIMVASNALMAEHYTGTFFDDEGIPGAIVSLGKDATPEKVDAFRAFWAAEVKGQPYATPIIGGIDNLEIVPYKPALQDMAFKEYSEWLARIAVAAFEMSPQDVGLDLKMYQSAASAQQELSKSQGINSLLNLIQEYINQEIIWEDVGWNGAYEELMFQWDEVDVMDEKKRADIDEKEIKLGIKSINEARMERGLDHIAGGERNYIMTASGPVFVDSSPMEDMSEDEILALRQLGTEDQQEEEQRNKVAEAIEKPKEVAEKIKKFQKATEQQQMEMLNAAFVDNEKYLHAIGGKPSFIAIGERITLNTKKIHTVIFEMAASMAHEGLEYKDIESKLNVKYVGDYRVLKKAVDFITDELIALPHRSYAVITHYISNRAEYCVYFIEDKSLIKSYKFIINLQKKKFLKTIAHQDLTDISNDLTDYIQQKLKSMYPKLAVLIPSTKKAKKDYEDWDITIPEDKIEFDPLYWTIIFGMGAGAALSQLRGKKPLARVSPGWIRERVSMVNTGILKERSKMSARSAANTLDEDVRHFINNNQDLSYDKMARGIKEVLGWEDAWRARRIAVTESRWAFNKGSTSYMKEFGIKKARIIPGPNPCPICEEETNNFRKIYKMEDADGTFPLHPNCHCQPIQADY